MNFLVAPPDSSLLYIGHYDPLLVLLSVLIAVFASFGALEVSVRMRRARGPALRTTWLTAGALAMGGGIWAMHFVGMLAFSLPCGVRYDPLVTLASMVPGMFGSAVALHVISRPDPGWRALAGGGLLMGGGIGTMHYAGMAAMRMDALLRYDPALFALSIIVAVALAVVALAIRFHIGGLGAFARRWASLISALVMGSAVSGMHYTAMGAAYFIRSGATQTEAGL
ncbi:partial putative signaling protein, partial [Rhodocyclaceae bacterium]